MRSGTDAQTVALRALDRVIHCLDRAQADVFRIKAFVKARQVVGTSDPEEFELFVAAERVTTLSGIGSSTTRSVFEDVNFAFVKARQVVGHKRTRSGSTLDHSDSILSSLDVVVASVHSKLKMPSAQMTDRMLRASNRRTWTSWAIALAV